MCTFTSRIHEMRRETLYAMVYGKEANIFWALLYIYIYMCRRPKSVLIDHFVTFSLFLWFYLLDEQPF